MSLEQNAPGNKFRKKNGKSFKALDETKSFLEQVQYDKVVKLVQEIISKVMNQEACYYQKLLIFGFGGLKCEDQTLVNATFLDEFPEAFYLTFYLL